MVRSASQPVTPWSQNQEGVALVLVLLVTAAMAGLVAGVGTLVAESGRSARDQAAFTRVQGIGETALMQTEALLDSVSIPGEPVPVPARFEAPITDNWASDPDGTPANIPEANLAAYLRNEIDRYNTCDYANPDLRFTIDGEVNGESRPVQIRACLERQYGGSLAGAGSGPEHLTDPGVMATSESMIEADIWARWPVNGEARATAQMQAVIRGIY